ncbi:hypothetical protein KEM52_003492, partial [Ascosphaera acerosa]
VRESAEKARQLELQNSSSGPVTPLPAVDIAEAAEPAAPPIAPTASAVPEHPIREADARQPDVPAAAAPETATAATAATKLSAWHSFHTVVGELDAAQEAAVLAASSATQDDPQNHHLTWKKVETGDDGLTRTGAEVTVYDIPHGRAAGTAAAGLQGGAQAMRLDGADADPSTTVTSGVDAPATGRAVAERNPDEIDLDLSDDDGGSDDDDAEGDAGSGVQLPDAKRVPVAATDAAGSAGNADAPPGTVHAPDSAATGARTEPTAAAEASRPAEMAGPAAAQPAASQDGATSAPRPDPAAPLNAMAKPFTMAAEPTARLSNRATGSLSPSLRRRPMCWRTPRTRQLVVSSRQSSRPSRRLSLSPQRPPRLLLLTLSDQTALSSQPVSRPLSPTPRRTFSHWTRSRKGGRGGSSICLRCPFPSRSAPYR